jgi:CheY-like chemotaxis protein
MKQADVSTDAVAAAVRALDADGPALALLGRSVAHAVVNDLTAARLHIELLRQSGVVVGPAGASLGQVAEALERAGAVMQQFGAVHGPGGQVTAVDLVAAVTVLEPLLRVAAGAGVDVVLDLPDHPVHHELDAVRVKRDLLTAVTAVGGQRPGTLTVALSLGRRGVELGVTSPDGRRVGVPVGDRPDAGADAARVVLVVEDDRPVRELVCRVLADAGLDVRGAADAVAGLAAAGELGPRLALLVTDYSLPGMSGEELATVVRREHAPNARVLVLSGFDAQGDFAEAWLRKPFRLEDLAARATSLAGLGEVSPGS